MSDARTPLLEVRGLCKTYRQGRWWERRFQVRALDNVDLTLHAGSTVALVGESGSGKTTLAMCLMGLENQDAGDMQLNGQSLREQGRRERARNMQLIFQDSAGALNPSMSASEIIEEPLLILGRESGGPRRKQVSKAMEQVGLPVSWGHRRPYQLSGGQRQRLAIARALVVEPKLLILDEALAGLDLSIQGQISNLLLDLQAAHGLSYLYISHNLALVAQFADEIVVLHKGQVTKRVKASEVVITSKEPAALPGTVVAARTLGAHAGGSCSP
jgi:ABC-type dipeptide/oligopeptide/nickel transport system ATPase subunit